ncbi:RNA polymerase sigma factor [Pseudidiomarina insulisalsae]|uniref:RNA polymerase subunit sigma-70 n=1 Tax=Pseudidiomarina insulisalsae TaxID=575789 RepID=A0A432YH23_9GAMM|nr:RNA polymerase sigma factor [Pseudidiomarina insulisalsae]RUO60246.1 hypothetical protein CWI71_07490 [Pseudidiomarina insulisalsae]
MMPDQTQQRYLQLQPHVPGARVLAEQLLNCSQRAADMVQDALEKALTTQHFPAREKTKAWFLQVVRNRCLDELRHLQRLTNDTDLAEPAAETWSAERQQQQNLVQRALAQLSAEQRDLLVLREFNDCSYADIAIIMGIPAGTVMSGLHRARLALRHKLQRQMGVDHEPTN